MTKIRVLILIGLTASLIIFTTQNLSPALPLVVLGQATVALPLSAWLVLAIAGGALVSVAIALVVSPPALRSGRRDFYRSQFYRPHTDETEPPRRSSPQTDAVWPEEPPPASRARDRDSRSSSRSPRSTALGDSASRWWDQADWGDRRRPESDWSDWFERDAAGQFHASTAESAWGRTVGDEPPNSDRRGYAPAANEQGESTRDRFDDREASRSEAVYPDDDGYDDDGYDDASAYASDYARDDDGEAAPAYDHDYDRNDWSRGYEEFSDRSAAWGAAASRRYATEADDLDDGDSYDDESVGDRAEPLDDFDPADDVYDADYRVITPPYTANADWEIASETPAASSAAERDVAFPSDSGGADERADDLDYGTTMPADDPVDYVAPRYRETRFGQSASDAGRQPSEGDRAADPGAAADWDDWDEFIQRSRDRF